MTLRRLIATKTFACLSISLLLSACSSNSGDGKDTQPPPSGQTPPQVTEIELQGVASKGLLYGAQIRAYEISTQGLRRGDVQSKNIEPLPASLLLPTLLMHSSRCRIHG